MQMRYRPLFAHLRPIPLTNRPDLPKGERLLGDKNKEPFFTHNNIWRCYTRIDSYARGQKVDPSKDN